MIEERQKKETDKLKKKVSLLKVKIQIITKEIN